MDRLNVRMTEIYGHRWTSQYPRAALDTWAKGLAGMSTSAIGAGVSRCLAGELAWPPTLPEFKAMCQPRPEDIGVPSVHAAWTEALDIACKRKRREDCSHPVVWHAYCEAGDIGHMPEDKGRKAFDYAYSMTVQMAMRGEPLREIPKALPAPQEVRATPEEVEAAKQKALEQLDAMMGRRKQ